MKTDNRLEQIQDGNLKDFKIEVDKIDDINKLNELTEIEARDNNRKGAMEIIVDRAEQLLRSNNVRDEEQTPEQKKAIREYIDGLNQEGSSNEEFPKDLSNGPARPATEEEIALWKKEDEEREAREKAAIEKVVVDIKEKRLAVDRMLCKLQHHMMINETPERSFFLTKAWLGSCLGQLNAENPYAKEAEIKTRKDIPATAEHDDSHGFKAECVAFNNVNAEVAVIGLREELLSVIKFIEEINNFDYTREFAISRTQAWINATEARFALGVILGSLKV